MAGRVRSGRSAQWAEEEARMGNAAGAKRSGPREANWTSVWRTAKALFEYPHFLSRFLRGHFGAFLVQRHHKQPPCDYDVQAVTEANLFHFFSC